MIFNLFRKPDIFSYEYTLSMWFLPWGEGPYPEDAEEFESNIPKNAQKETLKMLKTMTESCVEDFKNVYKLNLDYTARSLKEIDKIINPELRRQLEKQSNPEDSSNIFLITICEIGAYLGEVFLREVGGKWIPVNPYWDSPIIDEHGGENNIFHWAIKRFSTGELEEGSLYKKFIFAKEAIKSGKFKEMELDAKRDNKPNKQALYYDEDDE